MLYRLCYAVKMEKKKNHKKDSVEVAFDVFQQAIREKPTDKNPHAVALGRLGGRAVKLGQKNYLRKDVPRLHIRPLRQDGQIKKTAGHIFGHNFI